MILSAAAVTMLAAQCAPPVTWDLIPKIAWTESKYDSWAIHDNTVGRNYSPADRSDAVTLAANLMIKGHSLDLGIMQINTANLSSLGLTVETAFDACASVRAASQILQFVSAYNTGSPSAGFRNHYVARVVAVSSELKSPRTHSDTVPPAASVDLPQGSGAIAAKHESHRWLAFRDPAEISDSNNDNWSNR